MLENSTYFLHIVNNMHELLINYEVKERFRGGTAYDRVLPPELRPFFTILELQTSRPYGTLIERSLILYFFVHFVVFSQRRKHDRVFNEL